MSNKSDRVALVAGGAGFIGSHLCDALLERGWRVACLDNLQTGRLDNIAHLNGHPRFEFTRADVVEPLPPAVARRDDFSVVFNLACAASPPHYQADPEHTLLTNVLGTRHLLHLAERCGARFVLASTSEVYGDPEVHPQAESYWGHVNPTGPRACYDEGKRAAETLAFDYARAGRVDVRVARIFNTYGPRMDAQDGRVVSNVVTQALQGAPITIYGDGSQTRSFCYVDDLVAGLLGLADYEGDQPGPVNLGNPIELEVNDLVQRVLRMTGAACDIVNMPLPVDDPRRRRPDIARAKEVLGWAPNVPLEQGLAKTIDYFAAELGRTEQAKSAAVPLHGTRGSGAARPRRAAAAQP
jgi:UDP-glucuronate decarboxylase